VVNEVEHKELTSRSDSPDPAEQGRELDLRRWTEHFPDCELVDQREDRWRQHVAYVNLPDGTQRPAACDCGLDEALALYESSQQKEKEKEDK
jgi:hypothetical protein